MVLISHAPPGRYKILNNRIHPQPRGWDDPVPGCGIPPGADACGRFAAACRDGLGKQLRSHEMGAGAGGQIAAVLHQLHAAQVDLTVALDGVFHGVSGLGEGRRIQDHHIKLFALLPPASEAGQTHRRSGSAPCRTGRLSAAFSSA